MTKINDMQQVAVENHFTETEFDGHRKEIIKGLTAPVKHISSKFLYDDRGSELFEKITHLPEYYPPKLEIKLLKESGIQLAEKLKDIDIVELGSGDCSKISVLLESIPPSKRKSICYLPFDISQQAVEKSSNMLSDMFPAINIKGMVADFHTQLDIIPRRKNRLFCFFGSTLGNFSRQEATEFITRLSNTMEKGDMLLMGLDMVKDKKILKKAYNDSQNITAQFNLNILNVVNNYIETKFEPDDFEHIAFYNNKLSRIEMHLKAKKDMVMSSPWSAQKITIKKEETIHTENSHKFTNEIIHSLAHKAGLKIQNIVTDSNNWFSIVQIAK